MNNEVTAAEQMSKERIFKQTYPSIDLAFPIAIDSYDSVIKRIDALDARIQSLTTFAVSVAVAIPVLGKTQELKLGTPSFVVGIFLLVLAITTTIYARFCGEIAVLSPVTIYKQLHISQEQFKVDIINAASQAYQNNTQLLKFRGQLTVLATIIFAVSLLMLVVWATGSQI